MKHLMLDGRADTMRPYEKCRALGPSSLTDAELLAVILRTGVPGVPAEQLADQILHLPGCEAGLGGLGRLSAEEFMQIPGIGEVKAVQLTVIAEMAVRIACRKAGRMMTAENPAAVAGYYMEQLRQDTQENVICLMLDSRNHFIGDERLTRGTVNASLISTRDIFLCAVKCRAVAILLVHNHPGGDPSPSEADIELTERVAAAGRLLDIHLLDHIIIGDGRYISFSENGLLKPGSVYVQ